MIRISYIQPFMVAVVFIGIISPVVYAQIPADKWQSVLDLQQQAYQANQDEQNNPNDAAKHRERLNKYRLAYQKLDMLIKATTSIEPVTMVRLDYRCALFADYAGLPWQAYYYFRKCQDNPSALKAARWEDRVSGTPLELLVTQRMASLDDEMKKPSSRLGHMRIEIYKGQIWITSAAPLHNLRQTQQTDIAKRLYFTSDEKSVATLGFGLLNSLPGQKCVATKPGLVVFGMEGTEHFKKNDLQALTDDLAKRSDEFRKKFISRYLQAASDKDASPPIIAIYANLMPYRQITNDVGYIPSGSDEKEIKKTPVEDFARRLSGNLHYSGMEEVEGYYQPLDNSIVLRKGLRSKDKWYFGTACHEMVHALIHMDAPDTPLWLDEGLASMHEEMNDDEPIDNYRLYYLKAALQNHSFPLIENMISPSSTNYNDPQQRVIAAMSRYFCIYLNENHKLDVVYTMLRDQNHSDASSNTTDILLKITGAKSLTALNGQFQQFIQNRDTTAMASTWGDMEPQILKYISDNITSLNILTSPPNTAMIVPDSSKLPDPPTGKDL